jgi:cob(I)alamin adenosyltransferase
MKLYTRTGDKGTSSLYNGTRVEKTSHYFKLLGDLDELNSNIGMSKSLWKQAIDKSEFKVYNRANGMYRELPCIDSGRYYEWYNADVLTNIQCTLMDISSFIATPPWDLTKPIRGDIDEFIEKWAERISVDESIVSDIEAFIDRLDSLVKPITNFVVPGNDLLVSSIHVCRTVARRCERSYLEFLESGLLYYGVYDNVDIHFQTVQIYLNRLSDMFFALSRFLAMSMDVEEECYSRRRKLFTI